MFEIPEKGRRRILLVPSVHSTRLPKRQIYVPQTSFEDVVGACEYD